MERCNLSERKVANVSFCAHVAGYALSHIWYGARSCGRKQGIAYLLETSWQFSFTRVHKLYGVLRMPNIANK